MTSTDGLTWTGHTTPGAARTWSAMCWSDQLRMFVAVGKNADGSDVMTSTNGTNWTLQSNPAGVVWNDVCWAYDVGLFVACGAAAGVGKIMKSSDGVSWSLVAVPAIADLVSIARATAYGGPLFIAIAASDNALTSDFGVTWNSQATLAGQTWKRINFVVELGGFFIVGGDGVQAQIAYSDGAGYWQALDPMAGDLPTTAMTLMDLVYDRANKQYVAVGQGVSGANALTSQTGFFWEDPPSTTPTTGGPTDTWTSVCDRPWVRTATVT